MDWLREIDMINKVKSAKSEVTVGLVGKYVELPDAYISVAESLHHGGIQNSVNVKIKYISSEDIDKNAIESVVDGCDGILIPGGFGERGVEGKIETIRFCRENNIPCFGICLGMQMMVVEYLRNVSGISDANSAEFDEECENKVIDIMEDQNN